MTDELRDVSHTPPHDGRNRVQDYYERGPGPVADGGERVDGQADESDDESAEDAMDDSTLKDVDHTPPEGEGVNNVYRRGEKRE